MKTRARRQLQRRKTRSKKLSKKYKKRLIRACKLCKDENVAQLKCHKQLPRFSRNRTRKMSAKCVDLWRVFRKCIRKHGMWRGSTHTCNLYK